MCGICGEIRFDGRSADVAAVTRATAAMASRGPDSDGVVAHGPVAFGHRRLSIIDLSARGAQPMADSDLGLTLVFNGCIYNYKDLRKELEALGYQFFSTADSEVVIKAFHRWGPRCVERFKGMFAFAVAERDTGAVTLARDRLGIKPLYVSESAGRLRFASTVRALLEAGDVDTELDRYALHHYMSFHSVVPAPRTIYRGVRKLPPATVRVIQPDGTFNDIVYWTPVFERAAERADWSKRDWEDALMGALRAAVERRMVADVPVGVLLSGGIDSSVVVALLAEQGQHGLATFSIGFDSVGGESGDEYFYSD
ncbi:MAG: asparagine synthase (glutamine-hydrolyzing), partial [Mycobacteriaceae bacterium]|nr:asparagine synthase (glutamine-hydrolyzing) [Mycobacteriaceae bacterium]